MREQISKISTNWEEIYTYVYDRPRRPPMLQVSPVLAPARRSNPVLAPEERFWRPFPFLKDQTKINSLVWNKAVTWTISNNFCFILFPCLLTNIIFFGLTKNGRQNRSSDAKTGLLRRGVPKVSSRVTLVTFGAGVVCHMFTSFRLIGELNFSNWVKFYCSRCSFSMMVKWANDGLLRSFKFEPVLHYSNKLLKCHSDLDPDFDLDLDLDLGLKLSSLAGMSTKCPSLMVWEASSSKILSAIQVKRRLI